METVLSKDGTKIAFDRVGDGPPVVFVAGAFQHRAIDGSFPRVAELLAGRFTLYHYDRRGRGDSGDTAPYSVEREIEDLDAIISESGGSAFAYGVSSGAVLALEAAGHGSPITKLALYEPPFIVDDSRPLPPDDLREQYVEMVSTGKPGDAVALFLTAAVGLPAPMVDQMRDAPVWGVLSSVAHTLAYDAAVMGDTQSGAAKPLERWATVDVPAIVVDGGASPDWARNAVRALVDVLPKAEHRTLEGQTHDVSADAIAPVLEGFFS
ncbi:MAG: alpha/beta hydrolase [Actinobacteria bacterium]|nr:MAG: alpha/beta hydrolase [Actinomycetota bacterium]